MREAPLRDPVAGGAAALSGRDGFHWGNETLLRHIYNSIPVRVACLCGETRYKDAENPQCALTLMPAVQATAATYAEAHRDVPRHAVSVAMLPGGEPAALIRATISGVKPTAVASPAFQHIYRLAPLPGGAKLAVSRAAHGLPRPFLPPVERVSPHCAVQSLLFPTNAYLIRHRSLTIAAPA
jgi:hypothetical protein